MRSDRRVPVVNFGIRGHKTGTIDELIHDVDDIKALRDISARWQKGVHRLLEVDAKIIRKVLKRDDISLADMARFLGKDGNTVKRFLEKWPETASDPAEQALVVDVPRDEDPAGAFCDEEMRPGRRRRTATIGRQFRVSWNNIPS